LVLGVVSFAAVHAVEAGEAVFWVFGEDEDEGCCYLDEKDARADHEVSPLFLYLKPGPQSRSIQNDFNNHVPLHAETLDQVAPLVGFELLAQIYA